MVVNGLNPISKVSQILNVRDRTLRAQCQKTCVLELATILHPTLFRALKGAA